VLEKVLKVSFEDCPVPTLAPGCTEALIQIKQTGICGSDVHYYSHGSIGKFVVTSLMVLGHESSGVVVAVGSGCKSLKVGDRVPLEQGVPCRQCTACKVGVYNICADMAFATTPPFDGTLCKYYKLAEDFCYKLPADISYEEGALIEPLAVAVHICRQATIIPGSTVVVFGAGPVGLLCAAVARSFGAISLVASKKVNLRRFIMGRYKFLDAEQAFKDVRSSIPGLIKVLIQGPVSRGANSVEEDTMVPVTT